MAFAQGGGKGAMADINVTPLVDVMLVLLIIFMVTMPIESYLIKIDLPQARPPDAPENPVEPPEPIKLPGLIVPVATAIWIALPSRPCVEPSSAPVLVMALVILKSPSRSDLFQVFHSK